MTGTTYEKLHFSLMAILFALFSMVSFTACSSDDDDAPSQDDIKTNCIGMWQTTHISGWGYDDTEDENLIKVDQDVPEGDSERILFKGDGTYNGIGIMVVIGIHLVLLTNMRYLAIKSFCMTTEVI